MIPSTAIFKKQAIFKCSQLKRQFGIGNKITNDGIQTIIKPKIIMRAVREYNINESGKRKKSPGIEITSLGTANEIIIVD